jgi:hypothetical protein
MATTTNYGWTTPDDTALVKDGAAAIRTLGSSVDTTTKALNPSTTLGDIEYRSSTANTNTRLGIGTTGQVLTVAGGVPSWAAGAGAVIQVKSTAKTDTFTASTPNFADITGLSVSITPTSASNKILVMVGLGLIDTSTDAGTAFNIMRDSTKVGAGDTAGSRTTGSIGRVNLTGTGYVGAYNFLDSPATTSATTYKVQYFAAGATNAYLNRTNTDSNSDAYPRTISTITVIEVAP